MNLTKASRYVVLLILAIAFSSTALAETWNFPDNHSSYGDDTDIIIECRSDNSPACQLNNPSIQVCDTSLDVGRTNLGNGNYNYEAYGVNVPNDLSCDLGNNTPITIREDGSYVTDGGSIFVGFTTTGANLEVNMNIEAAAFGAEGSVGDLVTFTPNFNSDYEPGKIIVKEYDTSITGWTESYNSKMNVVLDSTSQDLTDLIQEDLSSCGNNEPCQVANVDFTKDTSEVDVSSCSGKDYSKNCVIGYDFGDKIYEPQNGVVVGQLYGKGEPPESVSAKSFHLCAPIEGVIGTTVYSPGDNYEYNQFRCNSQGEWENVALCNDGIDNDEDGAADLDDPGCSSTTDNSESTQTCGPRIGRLEESYEGWPADTKVAFYDDSGSSYEDSTSNCAYNNFDAVVYENQPPERFRCTQVGSHEGYSSSDTEDNGNAVDEQDADNYCEALSNIVSSTTWNSHGGVMEVVEYFVARKDVPTGPNKYATTSGFKNKFYQTLDEAEAAYAGSQDKHSKDTWAGKNLTDTSDYDTGEYIDSWTFANASANSTNEIVSTGSHDDSGFFKGGFAGKCPTGQQWQFTQEGWRCSGEIPWDHEVYFPNNINSAENGMATVGFFLMPQNFMESTPSLGDIMSFHEATIESDEEEQAYLSTLNSVCWRGGPSSKPSSFDEADRGTVWFAVEVNGLHDNVPTSPVPVTGSLNMSKHSTYTCGWGYTDTKSNDHYDGPTSLMSTSTFTRTLDERDISVPGHNTNIFSESFITKETFEDIVSGWKDDNGNSYDNQGPVVSELS